MVWKHIHVLNSMKPRIRVSNLLYKRIKWYSEQHPQNAFHERMKTKTTLQVYMYILVHVYSITLDAHSPAETSSTCIKKYEQSL